MRLHDLYMAVLCAAGLSLGQLLFKAGAVNLKEGVGIEFIRSCLLSPFIITAIMIYALIVFLWLWLLKSAHLSVVFPITALAYVIVPPISAVLWKEPYNLSLAIGSFFIVLGVWTIARA